MNKQEKIYNKIISLLDESGAEYKLFNHRAAYSYEDLEKVQGEAGFFGTEGKCMVLKAGDKFIVYVTTFGKQLLVNQQFVLLKQNKLNFDLIKEKLKAAKIRLATPEELKEYFGAEPGCAYPFGFDKNIEIFVDPSIYEVEWFLFSPLYPTKTIQVKGADLKKVFNSLENEVTEISFNL